MGNSTMRSVASGTGLAVLSDLPDNHDAHTIRRANLRRAFQLVLRGEGAATRAMIARETGLTSATASSLVAELIESGFVVDGRPAASTGGKPATRLEVAQDDNLLVVFVVFPRETKVGVLTASGRTIHQETVPNDPEDIAGSIRELAVRTRAGFEGRLLASGIQVPGTTDGRIVHESVQLGWRDVGLAAIVEEVLDVPAFVVNDVDAGAIAEAVLRPVSLRLFVHLGEGIGAATTAMTTVQRGATGRAGEIGHVRVIYEGLREKCRCGLTGCLESTCSMVAMLGDAYHDGLPLDETERLARAHAGSGTLLTGAVALSRALRMMGALLDPVEIVLGGSAPALGAEFLGDLRDQLEMYAAEGTAPIVVRYASLGAGMFLGAGQHALQSSIGVSWHGADGRDSVGAA
jgi:predicted NBD/HSP70 family sugar kinase